MRKKQTSDTLQVAGYNTVIVQAALVSGGKVMKPAHCAQPPMRRSTSVSHRLVPRLLQPLLAAVVSEQGQLARHAPIAGLVVLLAAEDGPAPPHSKGVDHHGPGSGQHSHAGGFEPELVVGIFGSRKVSAGTEALVERAQALCHLAADREVGADPFPPFRSPPQISGGIIQSFGWQHYGTGRQEAEPRWTQHSSSNKTELRVVEECARESRHPFGLRLAIVVRESYDRAGRRLERCIAGHTKAPPLEPCVLDAPIALGSRGDSAFQQLVRTLADDDQLPVHPCLPADGAHSCPDRVPPRRWNADRDRKAAGFFRH